MKILSSNFKKGDVKVKITNLDDLWYLSQIIDEKDIVQGETLRKIKIGDGENQKIVRKPVFLSLKVEKLEFHKQSDILRVSGIIDQGPEDVPKGTHHTFNIELNSITTIIKEEWLDFQIEKLKEASSDAPSKILLVVFVVLLFHLLLYNLFADIHGNYLLILNWVLKKIVIAFV